MTDFSSVDETIMTVKRQLNLFWETKFNDAEFAVDVANAIERTKKSFDAQETRGRYKKCGFSVLNTETYTTFLYWLSREVGLRSYSTQAGGAVADLADKIFYLNRIMNQVKWYWKIELPEYFSARHPLNSVLGMTSYGEYLTVLQNVTIGGSFNDFSYPTIGHHVTFFANTSATGNCHIGNYVVFASNASIYNTDIPDWSIVYGSKPNLKIVTGCEQKIKDILSKIWLKEHI